MDEWLEELAIRARLLMAQSICLNNGSSEGQTHVLDLNAQHQLATVMVQNYRICGALISSIREHIEAKIVEDMG